MGAQPEIESSSLGSLQQLVRKSLLQPNWERNHMERRDKKAPIKKYLKTDFCFGKVSGENLLSCQHKAGAGAQQPSPDQYDTDHLIKWCRGSRGQDEGRWRGSACHQLQVPSGQPAG